MVVCAGLHQLRRCEFPGSRQICGAQVRRHERRSGEARSGQIRLAQDHATQLRPPQVGLMQARALELRPCQLGLLELGPRQFGSREVAAF